MSNLEAYPKEKQGSHASADNLYQTCKNPLIAMLHKLLIHTMKSNILITKPKTSQKKLRAIITYEYRCKNPQQNTNILNPAAYTKEYTQ